jgi:hypothetical protein
MWCKYIYVYIIFVLYKGKIVPVLNPIKHYVMKTYGGVDV